MDRSSEAQSSALIERTPRDHIQLGIRIVFLQFEYLLGLSQAEFDTLGATPVEESIPVSLVLSLASIIRQSLYGFPPEKLPSPDISINSPHKLGIIIGYEAIVYTLRSFKSEKPDVLFDILSNTFSIPFELGIRLLLLLAQKVSLYGETIMQSAVLIKELYVLSKKSVTKQDVVDKQ